MCSCCKEGKLYPPEHQTKYCQQAEGSDPSPLFSIGEATHGALCPVLSSPVEEGHRYTGKNSMKGPYSD